MQLWLWYIETLWPPKYVDKCLWPPYSYYYKQTHCWQQGIHNCTLSHELSSLMYDTIFPILRWQSSHNPSLYHSQGCTRLFYNIHVCHTETAQTRDSPGGLSGSTWQTEPHVAHFPLHENSRSGEITSPDSTHSQPPHALPFFCMANISFYAQTMMTVTQLLESLPCHTSYQWITR